MTGDYSPRPTDITDFLRNVCHEVNALLGEYRITLDEHATLLAAQSWLIDEAHRTATSPETIARRVPAREAALSLTAELLSSIAEERPGTYPFDHAATIPVPLNTAMRTIHALSIVVSIYAGNNRSHRIPGLTNAIGALARIVGGTASLPAPSASPQDSAASVFLVPQPGIAYCARIIEGAARDLDLGTLDPLFEEGEEVTIDDLVISLRTDAHELRALNTRHGRSPEHGGA